MGLVWGDFEVILWFLFRVFILDLIFGLVR